MPQEALRSPERIVPIRKMLIANRGEIAVRAARACQARGIAAVIPYALGDDQTMVARMAQSNADKGWVLAPIGGRSQEESYANPQKMLETALLHGCDTVFLGYGFLAENADFVRLCEQKDIRVLAPSSQTMEQTGNKIKARDIARGVRIGRMAHIPVIEGSGNLSNFDEATRAAGREKYPVMLKDPDLGGGTGNLIARNEEELKSAYLQLRSRPGNKELYLERFIENAVHVEVQIAADTHGNVVSLGERDCTLQRRHQKIIEESPSPNINEATRSVIQTAAVNFARQVKYSGVGTWEFIVDLDRKGKGRHGEQDWYFMEVNPRIQVEHPVTEEQTDVDIVSLMIDIAQGKRLPDSLAQVRPRGHTIETRIYAENPSRGFEPSSGKLDILRFPTIAGVRVDQGVEEDDEISPWFDTTIAKAIAHGETREEAQLRLLEFLANAQITGVSNSRDFLIELLSTSQFHEKTMTTTFIEKWWQQRMKERVLGLGEFVAGGTFTPYRPGRRLEVGLLPQDVAVTTRGSSKPISTSKYREQLKRQTGKETAAEFGLYEREGVRYVLYHLNGQLGVDEGEALRDAARLAHGGMLPLVTVVTSGGADQRQNNYALLQMETTVQAISLEFPPLFHVNVYTGGVYGGVPASFSGIADIQIIVDSPQSYTGFTGPYPAGKGEGKEPASSRASDAYAVLPEGAHTPLQHFQDRNVHIIAPNLKAASDKIIHLLHILRHPATITDPHIVYRPKEEIGLLELSHKGSRFDRPGQSLPVWIGNRISGVLWHRDQELRRGELLLPVQYEKLSVPQRIEALYHPERPTAADLIDTDSGLFDDAFLLSNAIRIGGAERYLPVIAAIVKLDGMNAMVLAHQTQRVSDASENKYYPQRPEDWEYLEDMAILARKEGLPIITLVDTQGADGSIAAERRGQSHKIAKKALRLLGEHPRPITAVLLGMNGSGGGLTLFRPFNRAATLENAISAVSQHTVQYWIMTGRWIDKNSPPEQRRELDQFVSQLKDGTAEGLLAAHWVDAIIPEGRGGAHRNPRFLIPYLRSFITNSLKEEQSLTPDMVIAERLARLRRINESVTIPNLQL